MDIDTNLAIPHARPTSIGRVVAGLIVALIAIVGIGSTASAGGWAVSTLDAAPTASPGQSVDVGFTIRQHGVTPVDLDDVGIDITAADGTVHSFPAVQQGATGHYVATVTFPAAGEYTWVVQQGWFGPQDLGALTIAASSASDSGSSSGSVTTDGYRFPAIARYGLPALAAAFAAAALADVIVTRRRRRTVVA